MQTFCFSITLSSKTFRMPLERWDFWILCISSGKYAIHPLRQKNKNLFKQLTSGCVANDGHQLEIGEKYVNDNLAHQCFVRNSTVFYRQSICGMHGQPDCDQITEVRRSTAHSAKSDICTFRILIQRFFVEITFYISRRFFDLKSNDTSEFTESKKKLLES